MVMNWCRKMLKKRRKYDLCSHFTLFFGKLHELRSHREHVSSENYKKNFDHNSLILHNNRPHSFCHFICIPTRTIGVVFDNTQTRNALQTVVH